MDNNIKKQVQGIDASLNAVTARIRKSLDTMDRSYYDIQEKMRAIRELSKVDGQKGLNDAASFLGNRLDEIATDIKKASVNQLKNNKARLENLRGLADDSIKGTKQGAGVYDQYEILIKKLGQEIETRQKLGYRIGDFLNRQGINAISITAALTTRSPIVGLGIKYLLERNKAAKEADAEKRKASVLDSIAYRDLLRRQKEILEKPQKAEKLLRPDGTPIGRRASKGGGKKAASREDQRRNGEDARRDRGEKEPRAPRERRSRRSAEAPKQTFKKPATEKSTKSNDDPNIIDGEFEDMGSSPIPNIAGLLSQAPIITRPPDPNGANRLPRGPLVTPAPEPNFSYMPRQLNPGNFRNRNEKGRYVPGKVEGNYVPKQSGVEAMRPGALNDLSMNDVTKALGGLQITAVKISDELVRFHKEDHQQSDEALDKEEESRILSRQQQEELLRSIKMIGPGSSQNKELVKSGEGGLSKTVTTLEKVVGGLSTFFGGAGVVKSLSKLLGKGGTQALETASGTIEGAAEGATEGVAAASGGITAGSVAATAGVVAIGGAAGYGLARMLEKSATIGTTDKKEFGKTEHDWMKVYAEALKDNGYNTDRPWWMPYGIWVRRTSSQFDDYSKKVGGAGWFKEWFLKKHPDDAHKTFKYDDAKPQEGTSTPTQPTTAPSNVFAKDTKIKENDALPGTSSTVDKLPGTLNAAPTLVAPASASAPISAPTSTPTVNNAPGVPQLKMTPTNIKNNMKISNALFAKLKKREGFSAKPYNDPPGSTHWSIGYGHQIQPGENLTLIDEPTAANLLRKDLDTKYGSEVNKNVHVPLTQDMFDSLTDFTYNVGAGALGNIASNLNKGDYKGAGERMKLYNKSLGKSGKLEVNPVLTERRNDEASQLENSIPTLSTSVALQPAKVTTGQQLNSGMRQIEDARADIASSQRNSGGTTIVAPTNSNVNNTSVYSVQHDPRNIDNTYRDTRNNQAFRS